MKRAGIVCLLLAVTAAVSACAGADHSWRGEFDARLEGARASLEETLAETPPGATKAEQFQSYANLGRELEYKAELIEGLDPPRGCTEVQTKAYDQVKSSGHFASEVHGPDFPTRMLVAGRVSVETRVPVLTRIEHEAEACE